MAAIFDPPKAPAPPAAPTLSQAQIDAQASSASMIRAGAVGAQQTVLTSGLSQTSPTVGKSVLLGGTS